MVYQNNFVATIKSSGKILRENKDVVAVPFGAEYSIYLKNLSSVRAIANVWIDGVDTTDGNWVIVEPNSGLELERFIRNGNFNKGNKFKFIERTSQIEEHRGIGSDDGLIRVEYKFEVPQTIQPTPYYTIWNNSNLTGTINTSGLSGVNVNYTSHTTPASNMLRSAVCKSTGPSGSGRVAERSFASNCCVTQSGGVGAADISEASMMFMDSAPNETGITVPGGVSHQRFAQGAWFPTETTSHVIVLKLVGKVKGQKVEKPITVQTKPKCVTCGKLNKATHKFCDSCGTALQLL
jgi:hypothetical protein